MLVARGFLYVVIKPGSKHGSSPIDHIAYVVSTQKTRQDLHF